MEENREPLSAIAIEKKLQLLRNKHFSEDTIALVKSDYEYGLKEEEISLYLNKSYDIEHISPFGFTRLSFATLPCRTQNLVLA